MIDPVLTIAVAAVIGLCIIVATLLRGWRDWLALKARELDAPAAQRQPPQTIGSARIEVADLKERVRKLEAIASGIDL